ncbi:MAG: hypothetical protein LBE35_10410 [Clostridiales bacterium]|jgi:hypothetical protein|nr:hypothetical protein [Clostridiales bacterium]
MKKLTKRVAFLMALAMLLTALLAVPAYGRGWGRGGGNCGGGGRGLGLQLGICRMILDGEEIDIEALIAEREAFFNELVAEGRITRAQADESLLHLRERVEFGFPAPWCRWYNGEGGPGFGGFGGRGDCWNRFR